MGNETIGLLGNDEVNTVGMEPAKMSVRSRRRKAPARKRFDKLITARLKREVNRRDVVQYLAERLRTSASYVSRMLDNKAPRVNSHGDDYRMWRLLKAQLTSDEVGLLEEMETE